MLPNCARITYGNVATEVRVTQLDASSAAFIGTPAMAATFARMNFKLGEQWFDVEGVVVARWTGAGACACELRFSAMSSHDVARLKLALRPTERDIVRPTRSLRARPTPRARVAVNRPPPPPEPVPDPPIHYSKEDLQEIIREAMESLAV